MKRLTCSLLGYLVLGFAVLAPAVPGYAGPISKLYLTYTGIAGYGGIGTVQGNTIGSFAYAYNNTYEIPIAVDGDIRTAGYTAAIVGGQYSLAGTPTGISYSLSIPDASYDSTTDGMFHYLVGWGTGNVYSTDRNFANPNYLFTIPNGPHPLGITYDKTNNSLWFSAWNGSQVSNYSLGGALLSSFSTGHRNNSALALDHADQTLWLVNGGTGNLEQWSKAGVLLSTGPYVDYTLGGEFDFSGARLTVPEPSAMLVFSGVTCLLGLARLRRRSSGVKIA